MSLLISMLIGALFGLGLSVAGMIDPAKVLNFLDLAGHWDPTLAFVMGGAVLVTLPAYQLAKRRTAPLLAPKFSLPTKTALDKRLLVGAACFGIGWGIAGLCPGPAIAALSSGQWPVLGFVLAMIAGQWLADRTR